MTHYECCYSSGKQHVFAESRNWVVAGVLAVAVIGLVVGLSVGITVSIVGLLSFEALVVVLACWTSYVTYRSMFRCMSSSVDVSGYVIGNVTFLAACCCVVGAVRLSWQWGLGAMNTTALLSVGGVLLGVLSYGYACLLLQEDERKHHLSVQRSDGAAAEAAHRPAGLRDLWRFLVWIATWQWFRDASALPTTTSDEEESIPASEAITFYNDTLKLVKVCLYAEDDLMCWVPYGGISGRCVCLVHAEGSKTFDLRGADACGRVFQMKVFQPGVLDKELACCARAQCGQTLTFSDVEGMVRRSRSLSSAVVAPPARRDAAASVTDSEDDCSPRCSLSGHPPLVTSGGLGSLQRHAAAGALARGGVAAAGAGGGGLLRRCGSSGHLVADEATSAAETAAADGSGAARGGAAKTAHAEARKAAPDEVVVRNRSSHDVSTLLFNANDYCFLVPLCGESIPPRGEYRFNPQKSAACEFTLKVYSVGPGARELTYLTVNRGSTYMFCDSLLS